GLRGRRQRSVDDRPPRSFERGSRPTGAQNRGHRRGMREEGAPSREAAAVEEEILEGEMRCDGRGQQRTEGRVGANRPPLPKGQEERGGGDLGDRGEIEDGLCRGL